jgi:tetratricopeptide (TPR) repeat protein
MPTLPRRLDGHVLAFLTVCLFLVPSNAAAQRQAFADEIVRFRMLLFGPYGDEGSRLNETLDRLSAALMTWDQAVRDAERQRGNAAADDRIIAFPMLLAGRGRLADALRETDAALAAHSGRRDLHMLRGAVLAAMGRRSDAGASFLRSWNLAPDDVAGAYLAVTFSEVVDADSGPLRTLVEAQPRGERLSAGAFHDVPPLISDRASKSPVFVPAAYADGFDAIAAGDYGESVARLRAAAARDPLVVDRASQSAEMRLGMSRLRAGMIAEAIAPLEAAVRRYEDSSEAHRILGTAYMAVGDEPQAVEHLQQAVRLTPDDERSRLALARVLRDGGHLEVAAESLRETLRQLPRSSEAKWMLAGVLESLGTSAVEEWKAAADARVLAGKADLFWQAAAVCDRHQQFDCVVDLLARRVRLDPGDPTVHRQLGLVLNRLGDGERAFAELAIADLLGGADAESLTTMAQLHLEAERFADAEAASRRAIVLENDRYEAHYVLGRAMLRLGRASEAREQLDLFRRLRDQAMDEHRRRFETSAQRATGARE